MGWSVHSCNIIQLHISNTLLFCFSDDERGGVGLDTEFTGAGVQEAGATGSLDEPEPSVGINKVFINVVYIYT